MINCVNGSTITAIQGGVSSSKDNCSWDDVTNMTKENTRKVEEDKRKMELLQQIKNEAMNIMSNYKEYIIEEKNNEFRKYREEFL